MKDLLKQIFGRPLMTNEAWQEIKLDSLCMLENLVYGFKDIPWLANYKDKIKVHLDRGLLVKHGFLGASYNFQGKGRLLSYIDSTKPIVCNSYKFEKDLDLLLLETLEQARKLYRRSRKKIIGIGHSEGGLLLVAASKIQPNLFYKIITICSPIGGTYIGDLIHITKSVRQMATKSRWIEKLQKLTLPKSVKYLAFQSELDATVSFEKAKLPKEKNVINITGKWAEHTSMIFHPRTHHLIFQYLMDKDLNT